jgi:hypothetical protein
MAFGTVLVRKIRLYDAVGGKDHDSPKAQNFVLRHHITAVSQQLFTVIDLSD